MGRLRSCTTNLSFSISMICGSIDGSSSSIEYPVLNSACLVLLRLLLQLLESFLYISSNYFFLQNGKFSHLQKGDTDAILFNLPSVNFQKLPLANLSRDPHCAPRYPRTQHSLNSCRDHGPLHSNAACHLCQLSNCQHRPCSC